MLMKLFISKFKMFCHFTALSRMLSSRCSITGQLLKSVPSVQKLSIQPISTYLSNFSWSGQNNPGDEGNKDVLASELRKANVSRLLELMEMHSSIMNNNHLVFTLKSLSSLKKDDVLPEEFIHSLSFFKFSETLKQRAEFFDGVNILNILKCLSILGIPSSSPLMHTYLQKLQYQINDLNLKQMLFLEYLLKKQESSVLVEGMKMVIPMLLENLLEMQMDREDLKELISLLKFAVEYNMSEKSLQYISDAILQNPQKLSVTEANLIVWHCIKHYKYQEILSELWCRALEILDLNYMKIEPAHLVSLVPRFSQKLFSSSLVKKACQRAVEELWPLSFVHTLVTAATKYDMYDQELLNYYCDLIVENEDEIKENSKISVLSIMEAFAKSGFVPRKCSEMLQLITNCEHKLNKFYEKPQFYLRLLLCFAVYDWYHPLLLERICVNSFVHNISVLTKEKGSLNPDYAFYTKNKILKDLLLLSQLVNIHGCTLNIPEDLRLTVMDAKRQEMRTLPLEPALQKCLGGSKYFLSGIFTQSGLFIDHYIVLQQGEGPMVLISENLSTEFTSSTGNRFVEDIQIPSDTKRIAIIVHASISKWSDEVVVTGLDRLPVKLLNREGFHVIEVNLTSWEKLSDDKKVSYLMSEIQRLAKNKKETTTISLD